MELKNPLQRQPGLPSLGMALASGTGRVDVRELMRRKMMRKMIARRMRNAEMVGAK